MTLIPCIVSPSLARYSSPCSTRIANFKMQRHTRYRDMRDIKSFRETFVVKIFNKNFKIKVGSGFFFFPFFFFFFKIGTRRAYRTMVSRRNKKFTTSFRHDDLHRAVYKRINEINQLLAYSTRRTARITPVITVEPSVETL